MYQGIPIGGYTQIVQKMLEGIEVRLNTDFFENREALENLAYKIVYTGMIDEYYDYCFGHLSYRTVRFENEILECENFQGNAVVNYTEKEVPWTIIIEHKHFEFGTQPRTVISREYSTEWQPGMEPYYPVNDAHNQALYAQYQELAKSRPDVIFGGRLGTYRYYDMDQVIRAALDEVERQKKMTQAEA